MLPQPSVLHIIIWWGVDFLGFCVLIFFIYFLKGTQCRLLFLLLLCLKLISVKQDNSARGAEMLCDHIRVLLGKVSIRL